MKPLFSPGLRVLTKHGEHDLDHADRERFTPAGTWGHIDSLAHHEPSSASLSAQQFPEALPLHHWNVVFPGGGWVILDDNELSDPLQYSIGAPVTLRELLLFIRFNLDHRERTILDDAVIGAVQDLTDKADELLRYVPGGNTQTLELRSEEAEALRLCITATTHDLGIVDAEDEDAEHVQALGDVLQRLGGPLMPEPTTGPAYGQRAACKHCGQDVEWVGYWHDRGGNRACPPSIVAGEVKHHTTTHEVDL